MDKEQISQHLLDWARNDVLNHFTLAEMAGKKESTWISGWLKLDDIKQIESLGHKVHVEPESGEYFYKITFNER